MITLNGKLRFAPGEFRVDVVPNAAAKAVRIRSGILKGETSR
jgi:hypothetical protein